MKIDTLLVRQLITEQFPSWADLPINPSASSGWDNRTFYLGKHMSIRLPSDAKYALQVQKEQYWLPKLQPHLPLSIPKPIAMGEPTKEYPWHWSIYEWLEGETASTENISDLIQFSSSLADDCSGHERKLQPLSNPFGSKVLPMSPVQTWAH